MEAIALLDSFSFLFAVALLWVGTGIISGHVANLKGHSGVRWFLLGILFGPIGLLGATGLPDRKAEPIPPEGPD